MDEIFGMHQWPAVKAPYLMCIPGPVMSEITLLTIDFIGKGGHSSEPHKFIDPTQALADFYIKHRDLRTKFKGKMINSVFPIIKSGSAFNVIPDMAQI